MVFGNSGVKILRERTGLGMQDCFNALKEANNDLDLALEILMSTFKFSGYAWRSEENEFLLCNVILKDRSVEIEWEDKTLTIESEGYKILDLDFDDKHKSFTIFGFIIIAESAYQEVKEYYKRINLKIFENYPTHACNVEKSAMEIKDDAQTMCFNFFNMYPEAFLDENIFIYVDNYYSYEDERFSTEDIVKDKQFDTYCPVFIEKFIRFAEILQEEFNLSADYYLDIAWRVLKDNAVYYFAKIWTEEYDKYLIVDHEKSYSIEEYLELIYLCDNIPNNKIEPLGCATYYFIYDGIFEKNYFPLCYKVITNMMNERIKEIDKQEFKRKLSGEVKNRNTAYSIDDIDIMSGIEFENFISLLFSKMGYQTEVTKHSGDQGIDIIAEKNDRKIGVQAKCYSGSVGNSAIQEVVAGINYYRLDKAIVVTNNFFTQSAMELAESNDVVLWDRNILKEKITELF